MHFRWHLVSKRYPIFFSNQLQPKPHHLTKQQLTSTTQNFSPKTNKTPTFLFWLLKYGKAVMQNAIPQTSVKEYLILWFPHRSIKVHQAGKCTFYDDMCRLRKRALHLREAMHHFQVGQSVGELRKGELRPCYLKRQLFSSQVFLQG